MLLDYSALPRDLSKSFFETFDIGNIEYRESIRGTARFNVSIYSRKISLRMILSATSCAIACIYLEQLIITIAI